MSSFRDLRFGFRTLGKHPGLAFVAIVALTLGIGLTTTMFSIVYGALMRGLPFPEGDRIMVVSRANPSRDIRQQALPIQDFADYKAQQRTFSEFGAYTSGTMNVSGTDRAERFDGSWVTANTFTMVGARPIHGRDFRPGDDTPQGPDVAVLSYTLWQNRYNGDTTVLGTTIRVNGVPHEVIGIMPEGFVYPNNDKIWLPLQSDPRAAPRGEGQFVTAVAKLKPNATLDEATVDLNAIARRLAIEYPQSNEGFEPVVTSFIDRALGPEPRQLLYTMLGAVFFVLLIACSNVANLLLDRAAHRTKEVGIRAALGASRRAVVGLFLSEALVLSLAGTALGIALAYVGIRIFNGVVPPENKPFFIDIALHWPVLVFTTGVMILATLFSGVIPAIQASRADINEVLKDESRGASSFRIGKMSKALVVFEIALSCGLLVAAGLMIKSVTKIRTMDPGFVTREVFTARVGFPVIYTDTVLQRQFFLQLDDRIHVLPGVLAASISSGLPGARQGLGGRNFAIEGETYERDVDYPNARTLAVTPGFFETLRIPLRRGRLLAPQDRLGSLQVAVVNERFAREHFNAEDPVGRRIRYGASRSTEPWLTIVGVVADVFGGDPEDPKPALVIRPFAQEHSNFAYISARTAGPPLGLTMPVRDAVGSLNADIPIYWPMSLDQAIAAPLWFIQVFGTMFMIFGFVALFLASVGLYAVMSFSVSRRTREVGIRMALGAQAQHVVRMIFKQGLWQLGIGLILGLALAFGIAQLMSVVVFDVQPRDPVVFGGVAAVLIVTGLLACLVPARRATRVDPLVALRSE